MPNGQPSKVKEFKKTSKMVKFSKTAEKDKRLQEQRILKKKSKNNS